MDRLPVHELGTQVDPIEMGKPQVYHLPDWRSLRHDQRLELIRWVAESRGRDHTIAKLAVDICWAAGARPRQYEKQAAALLAWVQDPENCYYMNEPAERLQDPLYTIKVGHGDCDDQVILLCSLFESIRLSWKLCLAGKKKVGNSIEKVRHIEGNVVPEGVAWTHIFCMVGTPPFGPKRWYFCETTVEGVPLGWDVMDGDKKYLPKGIPEMQELYKGPVRIMPPTHEFEPSYGQTSALIPLAVGMGVADAVEDSEKGEAIDWARVRLGIATGVVTAIGTTLALQYLNGEGMWKGRGSLPVRWGLWAAVEDE